MILCSMYQVFGAMAQLVARFHGMEEVTGSNPVSSTHVKKVEQSSTYFT